MDATQNLINKNLDAVARDTPRWGQLYGAGLSLALAELSAAHRGLVTVITPDSHSTDLLEQECRFFLSQKAHQLHHLPDWETLPYDLFSPHEDIISDRLHVLHQLGSLKRGLLILPIATLMQRLAPASFLMGRSFDLKIGDTLDLDAFRLQLEAAGYNAVSQVISHGEYALRGSLLDIFPMGNREPFRIDLFDDEIETIRSFDPETQLSQDKVDSFHLLPGHEFPLDDAGIKGFRKRYRERFEGDPQASRIYTSVSEGAPVGGIEYYLPLFFDQTATLFDYLPDNTLLCHFDSLNDDASEFFKDVSERYEQRRHDTERPLLKPEEIYQTPEQLEQALQTSELLELNTFKLEGGSASTNFSSKALPDLSFKARQESPAAALQSYLSQHQGRVLFTADSTGRREFMLEVLKPFKIAPKVVADWHGFRSSKAQLTITVAALEKGVDLPSDEIAIIPESHLFSDRAQQSRRRRKPTRDGDAVVRNLTDLNIGSPVVHEDNGVGRYLGLQLLDVGGEVAEYLTLQYAGKDKLYVPVGSLHLISRYTGADADTAPLHKLGSDKWQKVKSKAAQKARDVAAELLDIYARRAARKGYAYSIDGLEYQGFVSAFPFEETEDQQTTIDAVLEDLQSEQPMDRVVCGDVGFGKTEVAMRAAFIVASTGRQVAILVPTTLLAQQHGQTFADRFSEWPFRIEALSRFRSAKEQKSVLAGLTDGTVDIIIGTHKLLQKDIKFKNLGLVIIDEEQRFGVSHKERLKSLRSEVDILTLTATPIPRTLNMSLAGLRDLSMITTPPMQRLAIKTFVSEWNTGMIQEACLREIRRGGQIYYLHNKVKTIEKAARELAEIVPEASIQIAHGQMRESQLEQVMLDFYHQRFNILVCTTIIETGIDVPTANTIIIDRADHFGLSQLHQLRGRVGRSHHRAYAYLITPEKKSMTADAVKRLIAIESLEDLGVGFTLATHDLEIRGAGELLGAEQSGQIQEVGYSMYNDLLQRAVNALKSGKMLDDALDAHGSTTEVDIGLPALLPDDYVFDVHTRLILYKRIASADTEEQLRDLQIELIDRFGLLPEQAKTLFEATLLKLKAQPLGINRIDLGPDSGRINFSEEPNIDVSAMLSLIQTEPQSYRMQGQKKLQVFFNAESLEEKSVWVNQLLDKLSPKQEAA